MSCVKVASIGKAHFENNYEKLTITDLRRN